MDQSHVVKERGHDSFNCHFVFNFYISVMLQHRNYFLALNDFSSSMRLFKKIETLVSNRKEELIFMI